MDGDLVAIGKVARPYQGRGLLRITPLTDFPDRFSNLAKVFVVGEEETRILTVERAERKGKTVLLKFAGVETREEAWELVGCMLEVPEEELVPLPSGTYYIFQLIGMRALTEEGEFLGELSDVISTPANDLYVLKRGGQEVLIPAVKDVVKAVDVEKGEIVIAPIPGLLD